jgi:hypothetical protein
MNEHTAELLEIGVYAPIGLAALCAEKVLPVIRDEAQNLRQQVPAANFIGKMASQQINQQLRTRCTAGGDQLLNLAKLASAAVTQLIGVESGSPRGSEPTGSATTQFVQSDPNIATPPVKPVADLNAIEGYENLSAPQVLALLDGLTESELSEVETFENSHRQRRTILHKISQLRNP